MLAILQTCVAPALADEILENCNNWHDPQNCAANYSRTALYWAVFADRQFKFPLTVGIIRIFFNETPQNISTNFSKSNFQSLLPLLTNSDCIQIEMWIIWNAEMRNMQQKVLNEIINIINKTRKFALLNDIPRQLNTFFSLFLTREFLLENNSWIVDQVALFVQHTSYMYSKWIYLWSL